MARVSPLLVLALLLAKPAEAATLTATPTDIQRQLAAAKPGDTVTLVGDFPNKIRISGRPDAPILLSVDLSQAHLTWLWFAGASNWIVLGGDFSGAPFMSVQISGSDHLIFRRGYFHGFNTAALAVSNSNHIDIESVTCAHASGDCVDIGSSQFVTVNDSRAFDLPYSKALHTDMVQAWNVAGQPAVSDLTITHNSASGHMQGFDNFGGVGGTMSNVVVKDNVATIDSVWAASFLKCIQCTMTGNTAHTLAGMPHGWPPPSWMLNGVKPPGNQNGAKP